MVGSYGNAMIVLCVCVCKLLYYRSFFCHRRGIHMIRKTESVGGVDRILCMHGAGRGCDSFRYVHQVGAVLQHVAETLRKGVAAR